MLRRHQSRLLSWKNARATAPVAAAACAALMAGCSADIRRLEQPTYAIGEKQPIPQEPIGRRSAAVTPGSDIGGGTSSGPLPASSDRVASLPDAAAPVNPSHPFDAPRKPKAVAVAPAPAAAGTAVQNSAPIVAGSTIDVLSGDTLYGLSKRHHVSIAALMELNQLKSATLRPGQKLVLPANARRPMAKPAAAPAGAVGQSSAQTPTPPAAARAATPVASNAPTVATPSNAAVTDWDGSYVVKAGDSLFGVARAHKVNVAELQRVNGIVDVRKMRPGMTLKVPAETAPNAGSVAPTTATSAATPIPPVTAEVPQRTAATPTATTGGVRLLNPPPDAQSPAKDANATLPPAKVAGIGPVAVPAAAQGKFRWPAKGALLAGFGKRPDGAHNDGINISVPAGTDITAAEAGTVAYAGSEIKAYGNLVLIRHEGGWVTAYAHADQVLVKRGEVVTRGQIIAKAGATGSVDQPQVHFELRQGSKPVDPAPHMEK